MKKVDKPKNVNARRANEVQLSGTGSFFPPPLLFWEPLPDVWSECCPGLGTPERPKPEVEK